MVGCVLRSGWWMRVLWRGKEIEMKCFAGVKWSLQLCLVIFITFMLLVKICVVMI